MSDLEMQENITVFYSWQSDSMALVNRNFVEACLKKAAKKIGKENACIITVDRDTKGLGGTPSVIDSIMSKIRASDIFVWDATLVYSKPRPAPNPNVLIEFGYALAVLGSGRIIGVMNTSENSKPDFLPFDLRNRRWPICYSLSSPLWHKWGLISKFFPKAKEKFYKQRTEVREQLVNDLSLALKNAIKEPIESCYLSNVDYNIARSQWESINSKWLSNWYQWRTTNPQFEYEDTLDHLSDYIAKSGLPENIFKHDKLKSLHDLLLSSFTNYLKTVTYEMTLKDGVFVNNTKANTIGWDDEYDKKYQREIDLIIASIEDVWNAWEKYVDELRSRYPEVTHS